MEVHSNSFDPSKVIIFCHVGVNEVAFVDPINLLKVHGQPKFINVCSYLKNIEELCLVPIPFDRFQHLTCIFHWLRVVVVAAPSNDVAGAGVEFKFVELTYPQHVVEFITISKLL